MKRKVKISKGLSKLVNAKDVQHFSPHSGHFAQNPIEGDRYLNNFSQAQLLEIASPDFR